MKLPRSWTALAAFVALTTMPVPAAAQAARSGPTFLESAPGTLVLLPDIAYDYLHDRFLVVSEIARVAIDVQVLNGNGNVLFANRVRQSPVNAQNPRVAFSPDVNNGAGGYLVTWHETVNGSTAHVWGRMLSADGVALTGEFGIGTDAASSNWSMGAAVSYSTASREFLVAWMAGYGGANDIRFMRVNTAGAPLQAVSTLITAGTADWERDPSVAYNPHQDEFYIAYAGWVNAGDYGFVGGQRVKAGTGALIGGPASFGAYAAPLIPSVSYNSAAGQYLVAWYNRSGGGQAVYGAPVGGANGVVGTVRLLSAYYASYDALDVDYNPTSGDYLLVTHGFNHEDAAVSIKSDNTPYDNGFLLTNTPDVRQVAAGDGNFNPRVAASMNQPRYLAVTASKFAAIHGQFATSSATGGSTPPPPPPTPRAVSQPYMSLDVPSNGQPVSGNFAVSGWALDAGSAAGTGVDTVHVWAQSVSTGEWIWLGEASMGVSRPDVAAAFGSANFATSGFGMTATLSLGTYDVNVFAHSLISGTFNNVQTKRVTVIAPPSRPMMSIDLPVPKFVTTRSTPFSIGGWALDLSSSSGPGIEAIHVWAFPTNGGTPIMVGHTEIFYPRSDVAALFGGQFLGSGYSLQGALPPGEYNLVVFALSSVTRTFQPMGCRVHASRLKSASFTLVPTAKAQGHAPQMAVGIDLSREIPTAVL